MTRFSSGGSVSSGGYYRADVIRYASSGALDSTFGVSGVAQLTLPTGGFIERVDVTQSRPQATVASEPWRRLSKTRTDQSVTPGAMSTAASATPVP